MSSKHLSVTLPAELYAEVEAVSERERRSRADIVRDALALYLARRIPVAEPTPEEREAIREGQEADERGEYVTLEEWRREMGLDRDRAGAEGSARRTRARSRPDQ